MSAFETDTAVTRLSATTSIAVAGDTVEFEARIDPSWWIVMGPNGGYIAAIVARAITQAAGSPDRRLHSLTVHYLRPPVEGPCRVAVTIERVGRGVSAVSFRMSQERGAVVIGVAALAVRRDSIRIDELEMPSVDLPESIAPPSMPDGFVPLAMSQHYDNRPAFGRIHQPDAVPSARSGGWMRLVDATPVDEIALIAFTDAWWPPIMELGLPPMAVPTVDLTVHVRALPEDPTDYVLGEFVSPLAADGYLIEDGRLWSRSGRLLAESRQLAVLM